MRSLGTRAPWRWRAAVLAAPLAAMLVLAGCSSSGSPNPPPANTADGSTSSAPATSPPTSSGVPDTSAILATVVQDDTLAAMVPASIRSSGTLNVGSNVQSPPNNFYAEDGKTVVGYEKDLLTAIGTKLGLKISYSDMSFDTLITSLASGRVDVTVAGMNDNKTRELTIDFVDYLNSGIALMIQKGNPAKINSTADLCGKNIAVTTGTTQEQFAADQSKTCTDQGKPALKVTATDSDASNRTALQTGRVDVLINDMPSAIYISQTAGDGNYFEVVNQPPLEAAPYGIGVNKANSATLTPAIQKALQALMDDGTYAKIVNAWGIQNGLMTTATINGGS